MSEHRFLLRVPSELWERVCGSAGVNRRSLNAEIVWLLESELLPRYEVEAPGLPEVPSSVPVLEHTTLDPSARPVFKPDFKR